EDPSIYVTHDIPDKPTTLTGAASESVISHHNVPKKRRAKGLAIAMLSAALIGGAAVVAVKVTSGEAQVQATSPPITVDPPAPAKPDPVKADPVVQEKPKPPVAADPVVQEKPKPPVAADPVVTNPPKPQ